jgi:hypothetical protein
VPIPSWWSYRAGGLRRRGARILPAVIGTAALHSRELSMLGARGSVTKADREICLEEGVHGLAGRRITKVLPRPGSLSTVNVPWCPLTSA